MNHFTKWWTVLITIGLFALLQINNPGFIQSLSYNYYDQLQNQKEVNNVEDIVLVNIDEKAIAKEGQWPWPRGVLARYIGSAPPGNLYVLNILFSEPDRFGQDQELAEALYQQATVLSSAPSSQLSDGVGSHVGVALFGEQNENWTYKFPGLLYPIDNLANVAFGVGATIAIPDQPTGVVRRAPLVVNAGGSQYPSLALDTARVYTGEPSYQMKVGPNGIEWVRMGRQDPIVTDSYGQLPISFWNKFEQISILDLPDYQAEGKTFIIGVTAEGLSNPVPTPTGARHPHEVQGHLIYTLLSGVQIQLPDWSEVVELFSLVLVGLVILGLVYVAPTALAALASLMVIGGVIGTSYWMWNQELLFFDITLLSLCSLVVFAQSSFNKYFITYQQKQMIKKQFETYLDPRQVYLLQKDPSLLKLGGERKRMTFLFMDICGFTPVSEHYKNNDDPEGLVELINMYLGRMTEIILNNGGTIDKYMGDCIMAFWNAPLPCEDHADKAIDAALEISEAADELIKELEEQGLPRIDVGIGINTGDCIVGNMGSETRFDYSVIGDAVNLGARLEGQTRNYDGVRVLLSQFTAGSSSKRSYRHVDRIKVKGKEEMVDIYTV